jgi:hypothetical protein
MGSSFIETSVVALVVQVPAFPMQDVEDRHRALLDDEEQPVTARRLPAIQQLPHILTERCDLRSERIALREPRERRRLLQKTLPPAFRCAARPEPVNENETVGIGI